MTSTLFSDGNLFFGRQDTRCTATHTDLPRYCRESRTGLSENRELTSRAGSPSIRARGHRSGPHRGVRRDPGVYSRLTRAVSTRRPTKSCFDLAFWAEPFWRPGAAWPCALEDERCSDQIKSRGTWRGPRRLDRLVSRTQCE